MIIITLAWIAGLLSGIIGTIGVAEKGKASYTIKYILAINIIIAVIIFIIK